MARFTSPVQQPFAPLSRVAPLYLDQALMDIEKNMQAQRIYPTEVYRGYEKVNQYRKEHGMWWSTGEGKLCQSLFCQKKMTVVNRIKRSTH